MWLHRVPGLCWTALVVGGLCVSLCLLLCARRNPAPRDCAACTAIASLVVLGGPLIVIVADYPYSGSYEDLLISVAVAVVLMAAIAGYFLLRRRRYIGLVAAVLGHLAVVAWLLFGLWVVLIVC